ncbi:MAG: ATP-binding protein [Betaproteobacteria bacterium]|nr:ATP-binding protein [Betaproteobacteria bacterium]
MNRKLLTPHGLKFHPFSAQIPVEALWTSPAIDQFCWRFEQQLGEGGFALISGVSGSGKSATLRLLQARLASQREIAVGILSRPQAALADFYRELGDLFGVPLRPHNRWASAKALRERWLQHIDTSLVRPVLLVDEAQEMHAAVLSELRLLTSAELDSRSILTVVLAGDDRLCGRFETPELIPLASRIRTRLRTEALPPADLLKGLQHLLAAAGNPRLLTTGLQQTLCEHAAGNLRLLMNMAHELFLTACRQNLETLDEKLYLQVFNPDPKPAPRRLRV